jgi:hypothetical protein
MKHSRLFLGLTTCLLVVAGIVAAKANRHNLCAKIYTSAQNIKCISYGTCNGCTATPNSNVIRTTAQGVKTLYTCVNACTHKLYMGL